MLTNNLVKIVLYFIGIITNNNIITIVTLANIQFYNIYIGVHKNVVTILFNCTTKIYYKKLNSFHKKMFKKGRIVIFTIIFTFHFMILNSICTQVVVICYGQGT